MPNITYYVVLAYAVVLFKAGEIPDNVFDVE